MGAKMYESLREHFDVVLAVMLAAIVAVNSLVRARFVAMEKKLGLHDTRIGELEKQNKSAMEVVLSEVRVMRAEVKADLSSLRAWIAENYKRRGENGGSVFTDHNDDRDQS